jgi:hypothetical protein
LPTNRVKVTTSTAATPATAITTWFFTRNPAMNNGTRAADTGIYAERRNRAVADTGSTFHTSIQINDPRQLFFDDKYCVGTDRGAEAAANTFILIQFEGCNTLQILMLIHVLLPLKSCP